MEGPNSTKAFFHLTLTKNLPSIRQYGLRPTLGEMSKVYGEPRPAIYLFTSLDSAHDALMNWFGEALENAGLEDEPVAILKVEVPDSTPIHHEAFEAVIYDYIIPPSDIEVIDENQ